jgi:hypothetical protein
MKARWRLYKGIAALPIHAEAHVLLIVTAMSLDSVVLSNPLHNLIQQNSAT